MQRVTKGLVLAAGITLMPLIIFAQTETVVNVDTKHSKNGVSEFDRSKFITVHSSVGENDWNGDEDKLDYLIRELNVYFGRDNGAMPWNINQAEQDPNRPGFADPTWIQNQGQYWRETLYGVNQASRHLYDDYGDVMIGGQVNPFWPVHVTNPCCAAHEGWEIGGADAVGEFMGRFLNEFYRNEGESVTEGHPRPKILEVLNEPLYELTTRGDTPPIDVFQFHNDVADNIRLFNDDVLIGGYTTAFPVFEERNFARWAERMKLFIDTSGNHMDFFSIHLYDFNSLGNARTVNYFKGGRIEATMDMMEHYSQLVLNTQKPWVISEYGGRDHTLESQGWSPVRDWHFMKAMSPMLMQFMDRPDLMLKTLPFIVVKAPWGTVDGNPYPWRLLRQAHEAPNETGDHWVFTEQVKFYELWSDVEGTRVDTTSTNPNVLVDSYVKDNKVYLILSNLSRESEQVFLQTFGAEGNVLQNVQIKHLFLDINAPVLDEQNTATAPASIELGGEATAIITYTFASDIEIDQESSESKYYATTYLQEISANSPISFNINGVETNQHGEAFLRFAVGRDHGLSLTPVVSVNGTQLSNEVYYSGDDQAERDRFFSLLEVKVPYELLQENNAISVSFPDSTGHVASMALKVFDFSTDVRDLPTEVTGIAIAPSSQILAVGEIAQVNAQVLPFSASNQNYTLSSSDESIVSVDQSGVVTAIAAGEVVITATSEVGNFSAEAIISVEEPVGASITLDDPGFYVNTEFANNGVITVTTHFDAGTGETVTDGVGGIRYFLRELTAGFASVVKDIIVFDASVIGTRRGTSVVDIPLDFATPTADLPEGNFYFLFVQFESSNGETQNVTAFPLNIVEGEVEVPAPFISLVDAQSYATTNFVSGETMSISTEFSAGENAEVSDTVGGIQYFLRELTPSFGVVNDYIAFDASVVGEQTGTSSVELSLDGVPPSDQLPEGNFYFLFARFVDSNGTQYTIDPVFPISVVAPAAEPSLDLNNGGVFTADLLVGQTVTIETSYEAGPGQTVNEKFGGIRYFFRHLNASFGVVQDIIIDDASVIGSQSGTSSVELSLAGVLPSSELPEGDFYFLFAIMGTSSGQDYNIAPIFPISVLADTDGDGIADTVDQDDDGDNVPDDVDDYPLDPSLGVKGDFDGDLDVDRRDLAIFVRLIRDPSAVRAEYDFNGDGVVSREDARTLQTLCTKTRCAE
ncbi:Ig-like domain-containing protein [Agaribacter flavus]|uniref:Ig-like domain-containing protein n=1 Tax=Agaribacter flavus TaxID=1902781 RepID=A0ABV7FQJ3_9ALTE